MEYAINLNPVLPVRSEASERSEMVTQLLFGETCEILAEENSFLKIKNDLDSYTGWADKKMLKQLSSEEFGKLNKQADFRILTPIADVFCLSDKTIYRLPMGGYLPNYDVESNKFGIGESVFQVHPDFITYLPYSNKDGIVPVATTLLNSPYLWGGKSIMGIDCSGFVQVVFAVNGFKLPRDASQQVQMGSEVAFEELQKGDLLFFSREDRITHVGIYYGDRRIIHSSGKVRIDNIDKQGIFTDTNEYTHHLSLIKRIT